MLICFKVKNFKLIISKKSFRSGLYYGFSTRLLLSLYLLLGLYGRLTFRLLRRSTVVRVQTCTIVFQRSLCEVVCFSAVFSDSLESSRMFLRYLHIKIHIKHENFTYFYDKFLFSRSELRFRLCSFQSSVLYL